MFGSKALLIPGIVLFAIGATLQAGATGAVRAIKMSTKLGGVRDDAAAPTAPPAAGPPSPPRRAPPTAGSSPPLGVSDASSER
jgi:hypothetical protein